MSMEILCHTCVAKVPKADEKDDWMILHNIILQFKTSKKSDTLYHSVEVAF